ncbi:MAG: cytosine/uracil/thiamine/allantoin permease [Microbacterium sp.]|nr:cytosine/uracil/thiamine/allantoin permease [Microbacterium sp.]
MPTVAIAVFPKLFADLGLFDVSWVSDYSWFIGCGLGYALFLLLERLDPRVPTFEGETEGISDGTAESGEAPVETEALVLAQTAPDAGTPVPGSGAAAPDAPAGLAQKAQDAVSPEPGTASPLRWPTPESPREALA